ncbi:hypothetical protein LXL04_003920 [Taraxacum kok-saghyz]
MFKVYLTRKTTHRSISGSLSLEKYPPELFRHSPSRPRNRDTRLQRIPERDGKGQRTPPNRRYSAFSGAADFSGDSSYHRHSQSHRHYLSSFAHLSPVLAGYTGGKRMEQPISH